MVLCQHQASKKVRSHELFSKAWSGRDTSHILLAGTQSCSPTYPQRRLGDVVLLCAQDEKTFGEKLNSLCLPWRGEMMSQETQQAKSGALLRAPAPGECQAPGSSSPC